MSGRAKSYGCRRWLYSENLYPEDSIKKDIFLVLPSMGTSLCSRKDRHPMGKQRLWFSCYTPRNERSRLPGLECQLSLLTDMLPMGNYAQMSPFYCWPKFLTDKWNQETSGKAGIWASILDSLSWAVQIVSAPDLYKEKDKVGRNGCL